QFPDVDDPGGRILYMVMMPPGAIPQAEGNPPGVPCGAHSDPLHHDLLVFDPERAWVGWVYFSPGGLNDITTVFTHELTEAISDPMVNDGQAWVMNRTINGGDEIGDACSNTSDLVDGLAVQAYWSQRHRACVIPVGSGAPEIRTISVLEGSVDGGTQVVMTGRFLANAQSVSFGSVNAARFTVNSMTRITAVTPSFRAERQRIVDIAV